MYCYECLQAGVTRDAAGLCHHCSAALCTEHACVVADPVTENYPLLQTVVLPKLARLLLCGTCKAALEQPRSNAPHAREASNQNCRVEAPSYYKDLQHR